MSENDSRTVVEKLLDLSGADPNYLAEIEKLRRAVVVMFTDIQGSTSFFEKYGDAAGLQMVCQCNDGIRQSVENSGGRVLKTIGDGTMAIFEDCLRSVAAAIEIQATTLPRINLSRPESVRIAVRVGLHYGVGIVRQNDVFGDVVNVASRVESVAAAGQIIISDSLREELRQHSFDLRELGRFVLKGKKNERTLYEVIWDPVRQSIPQDMQETRATSNFRLRRVGKDGSYGAEYPILTSLTIGRSQGDVRFAGDPLMAPLNARISIEDGQPWVEDLSGGAEAVLMRIVTDYKLHNGDILVVGNQVLKFCELPGAMLAATQMGVTLADINQKLEQPVAELVQSGANGLECATYAIRDEVVDLGRNRGTYTFPDDRLMSRMHARIVQRGEDFLLRDLGSRNGTFLKVRGKTRLNVDMTIMVGRELLQVAA